MKEILINWINTNIQSKIYINPENCYRYVHDPEVVLIGAIEADWRNKLVREYLDTPEDGTIENFFQERYFDAIDSTSPLSKVEIRVLRKLLRMFNLQEKFKL